MITSIIRKAMLPGAVFFLFTFLHAEAQVQLLWGRQSGTEKREYVMNHVIDHEGNIIVSGTTGGSMCGLSYGRDDGFVTVIDSSGKLIRTLQFGSPENEDVQWSAIDKYGNLYITGSTRGDLKGKNHGAEDIFIVKYNSEGQQLWINQFGTDSTDIGKGVFADNRGFVYLTGLTSGMIGKSSAGKTDGFVIKLDSAGKELFAYQFGTPGDDQGISITGDNNSGIYVSGSTWGDLSGKGNGFVDVFALLMSDDGRLINCFQYGSEGFDIPMALAVDSLHNLYIGGTTSGNFGASQEGEGDCFLFKISSKGELLWNRQFGTPQNDGIRSIAINDKVSDNILVSGVQNLPPAQAFVRMYDKTGTALWEKNFDPDFRHEDSSGKSVSMDDSGNICHVGLTHGSLFSANSGDSDFFIVKLRPDAAWLKKR